MIKLRAIRGSLLGGGVSLLLRPLSLIATILLARLLDPTAFGVVALAMLLVASSNIVAGFGMGPALIHTDADSHQAAFQCFVVTLISGLGFALGVFVFAEPLARLLGDVTVAPVLRALSIVIFFDALSVVPNSLLSKELRFERTNLILFTAETGYLVLAIILAFLGFSVWSLVLARIFASLMTLLLNWFLAPGWIWLRPLPWNGPLMVALLRYGWQSTLGGIVTYLHTYWDDWLVGRRFGTTQLGYYNRAYELSNRTLTTFSGVIINVFFPFYVQLRDSRTEVARVYLKSYQVLLLIMTPIALGFLVTAPELVAVLFGQQWLPMIPLIQIYSIMVLTRPISTNTSPLFMALGRPDLNTRAGVLLLVIMVGLALSLLRFGTSGVAAAVVIAHILGMVYNVFQVNTLLSGTARQTLRLAWPTLFSGVVMVVCVWATKLAITARLGTTNSPLALTLLVLTGVAVYGGMLLLTQRNLIAELLRLLRTSTARRKQPAHFAT